MTSTPTGHGTAAAAAHPTHPQKVEKPTLTGTRIKQRKGVVKSQAKFEPEAFRDALYKYFDGVSAADDWDGFASALDKAGNTLDYRKYSDQLFEILIAGGLLAPGGSPLDDAPNSVFSVFAAKTATLEHVKPVVTTIDKVIRRYKFLQKPLEESTMRYLLQYITRFEPEQREKLAIATGLFIQQSLVAANVLTVLQKDALAKDDLAITFFDTVCKTYLAESNMDALGSALRKGGIKDALPFFPQTKRAQANLVTSHFAGVGLAAVGEYFQKRAAKDLRDSIVQRLREMRGSVSDTPEESDEAAREEITDFLKESRAKMAVAPEDFVTVAWDGLMKDQPVERAAKLAKAYAPILEPFAQTPKAQIALINQIQLQLYAEAAVANFVPFLKVLYSADVVSDAAIIFWHQKGHKPQGKIEFLAAAAPLVKFLEEQSDDEE